MTKLLHLKRPALVPVLDSLVIDLLGARGRGEAEIVTFVQGLGRANLGPLADALVRSWHPASVMYPLLGRWRSVLEAAPRRTA